MKEKCAEVFSVQLLLFVMAPLISVVTICRNSSFDIQKTIESILNQNFESYELIIKDGKSSDDTINKIERVLSNYSNKKAIVKSCQDNGIYNAMNQALDLVSGKWVIFINCGDYFADSMVLKNVKKYLCSNWDVVAGNAIVRDSDGDAIWESNLAVIKKKMPFCHQSCFMKTSYAKRIMFDEKYKIAADYNMILQTYKEKASFCECGILISIFDLGGISSTNYIQATKERYLVRYNNGVISKYYYLSYKYLLDLIIAIIKKSSEIILPKCFVKKLRYFYKKYVKKYKMPER